MDIKYKKITVGELTKGYEDNDDDGVVGYNGKLNIRPPYQREFIYDDKERDAVIDTLIKGFPLNVMYWIVKENGTFELMDGQQRTISICQFVSRKFSFNHEYFHILPSDIREQIYAYKLSIYLCTGKPSEKIKWFKTINIAGKKLNDQEMLNAIYSGPWTLDAKRRFSKNNCVAYNKGKDYVKGKVNRQEYLRTAIKWISDDNIKDYMADHFSDPNANELIRYFKAVIDWVECTFTTKRKTLMKGIDWGYLYNEYKDVTHDSVKYEKEIAKLILDDEVECNKGIYKYILTGDENSLNIRSFSPSMKLKVFQKQKGICKICGKEFKIEQMEADHIDPWHEGGKTVEENCQLLCKADNRRKSSK